jgi:hypothetical protein
MFLRNVNKLLPDHTAPYSTRHRRPRHENLKYGMTQSYLGSNIIANPAQFIDTDILTEEMSGQFLSVSVSIHYITRAIVEKLT